MNEILKMEQSQGENCSFHPKMNENSLKILENRKLSDFVGQVTIGSQSLLSRSASLQKIKEAFSRKKSKQFKKFKKKANKKRLHGRRNSSSLFSSKQSICDRSLKSRPSVPDQSSFVGENRNIMKYNSKASFLVPNEDTSENFGNVKKFNSDSLEKFEIKRRKKKDRKPANDVAKQEIVDRVESKTKKSPQFEKPDYFNRSRRRRDIKTPRFLKPTRSSSIRDQERKDYRSRDRSKDPLPWQSNLRSENNSQMVSIIRGDQDKEEEIKVKDAGAPQKKRTKRRKISKKGKGKGAKPTTEDQKAVTSSFISTKSKTQKMGKRPQLSHYKNQELHYKAVEAAAERRRMDLFKPPFDSINFSRNPLATRDSRGKGGKSTGNSYSRPRKRKARKTKPSINSKSRKKRKVNQKQKREISYTNTYYEPHEKSLKQKIMKHSKFIF